MISVSLIPQVAALAHDPQAMEEARQTVADADATLAVAKQQVAALEAETKPLEQVRMAQGLGLRACTSWLAVVPEFVDVGMGDATRMQRCH